MGEAVVAKSAPGMARDAPKARKPARSAFREKALLFAGIAALGGVPSYICIRGSVLEQRRDTGPTPAMGTVGDAIQAKVDGGSACMAPGAIDGFKPKVNLRGARE